MPAPYITTTPAWLRMAMGPKLLWEMPQEVTPTVYLTFDDGPHPTATPFVIAQLKKYNAQGTFFCVGQRVEESPQLFQSIRNNGHTVGNHTYNHLNGWKTDTTTYLNNIQQADAAIGSKLFRPPYGRIRRKQVKLLDDNYRICMWSILSGDFDTELSPEDCLTNVLQSIKPGAIIVFHDSEKAWHRLEYVLPHVLEYCTQQGWQMKAIPETVA